MELLRSTRWAALLMVGLGCGCGGSFSAICEAAAECEGGNDQDLEACEIEGESVADQADVKGCGQELDDLVLCIEEEADCDDDRYRVRGDDCENEAEDFEDCMD